MDTSTEPTHGEPHEPPPPQPSVSPLVRWLLMAFAALSLAMGIIGVFVPGLPTTVFILMAGWAAARSSPRLHAWMWNHPLFGRMLRDWARGGRVSRRAKWSATTLMALSAAILLLTPTRPWVCAVAITCMACVLAWLWRRPEPM
ncbi:MAG: DUF454 domain-containing protein [Burkholderiaceae bacterium]|nr:MAG: DUF454 domain-containing protein [Burkholderiaceae bacterium]